MIRRFLTRTEGTATVEFVILLPILLVVFMSTFEMALLTARYTMLERAMDMVVREIRLSDTRNIDPADVREAICTETARLFPFDDCKRELVIESTEVSTASWTFPAADVECVDRYDGTRPLVSFDQAGANRLILVRVCLPVDPWFPNTSGLGMSLAGDADGSYHMYAASAYVAEP